MPEHDDLSALDFSSHQSGSEDSHDESDALDFSAADESGEESDVDALYDYAPTEPEEIDSELEAIAAVTEAVEDGEDEGDGAEGYTVTNPPETVAVTALIDGRTQRVTLSATATKLSESELADEIIVLAELARKKGLAGQRTYLSDNASQIPGLDGLAELGIDSNQMLTELMTSGMQLPTPEQADAEQTEVFAARYTDK
jgi:ESX secretion-associated protein EspD/H